MRATDQPRTMSTGDARAPEAEEGSTCRKEKANMTASRATLEPQPPRPPPTEAGACVAGCSVEEESSSSPSASPEPMSPSAVPRKAPASALPSLTWPLAPPPPPRAEEGEVADMASEPGSVEGLDTSRGMWITEASPVATAARDRTPPPTAPIASTASDAPRHPRSSAFSVLSRLLASLSSRTLRRSANTSCCSSCTLPSRVSTYCRLRSRLRFALSRLRSLRSFFFPPVSEPPLPPLLPPLMRTPPPEVRRLRRGALLPTPTANEPTAPSAVRLALAGNGDDDSLPSSMEPDDTESRSAAASAMLACARCALLRIRFP
mmetsp:Transcript_4287/g.13868  ORF Transcript_4287/g.13868 Transcript_4287/m.13868 type:complete len:319 (+) Transcript_4287:348-1304(+)